jgi:hypothetical protein
MELTTVEGDLRFQGLRVRVLNAVTVTLARVIATGGDATRASTGPDPMAAAGTLIAMLAQVAAHRYGFEFWGIRTASLVDSQARLIHWSVTGRRAPDDARIAGADAPRPRTGPVLGGGAASARTAQVKAAMSKAAASQVAPAAVAKQSGGPKPSGAAKPSNSARSTKPKKR